MFHAIGSVRRLCSSPKNSKMLGDRKQFVFDQREGSSKANRSVLLITAVTMFVTGAYLYFKFYKPVQDEKKRKLALQEKVTAEQINRS